MASRTENGIWKLDEAEAGLGLFVRANSQKAPGAVDTRALLSSSSKIIPLHREFGYDSSSKKRHFPKSIRAVLGQLSHQDCEGVIVVLKEESTREITVKVSPTDKTARCQPATYTCSRRQQKKETARDQTNRPRARAQGAGLQHPKITPACQSKREAGCGPCWKQISLRAGA